MKLLLKSNGFISLVQHGKAFEAEQKLPWNQQPRIGSSQLAPTTNTANTTHDKAETPAHTLSYLTLRLLSTDMEEAGFCGRGMMGVVASLGRGGGTRGGGWYQEGCRGRGEANKIHFLCHPYPNFERSTYCPPLGGTVQSGSYPPGPLDDGSPCVGQLRDVTGMFL